MSQNKAIQNAPRALDPNVLQARASHPQSNVWVNASAGTGKTKVLIDRLLRLLLPDAKGNSAQNPQSILCITFTNAGASEMLERIHKALAKWSLLSEDELKEELSALLGFLPHKMHINCAQGLYSRVMNIPGGLKIMTIHAFCQSILARFPLEANLTPHIQLADENTSKKILSQSINQLMLSAYYDRNHPLCHTLDRLLSILNPDQFMDLTGALLSERRMLDDMTRHYPDETALFNATCAQMKVMPNETPDTLIADICIQADHYKENLLYMAELAGQSSKSTDQKFCQFVSEFLHASLPDRPEYFEAFKNIFIKTDGDLRKTVLTKDITGKLSNDQIESLAKIAQDLSAQDDKIKRVQCAAYMRDLLHWGLFIHQKYAKDKQSQSVIDFDDLIVKTLQVMKDGPEWVLYKLDQGINHILVDEAQDTNPEQWDIIKSLCEEFFAHNAQEAAKQDLPARSLFVVGDEKQSIYSFQRASPISFSETRALMQSRISQGGYHWDPVDMNISFRSTRAVLQAVDAVFSQPSMQEGMGEHPVSHSSFRRGQAGLVEIWPLFEGEAEEKFDPLSPPITIYNHQSGASKAANHIADQIAQWLDQKMILPARGRPVQPGDIMILMRTRSQLVPMLTRALKERNIPVSGADRMILTQQIAVQDILSMLKFVLLPQDDLNLACVLKTPLISLSEDNLLYLAYGRSGSLWNALQKEPKFQDIKEYLLNIRKSIAELRPFEAITKILSCPCPANNKNGLSALKGRLGEDCADPIEELRSAALNFEQMETPSLQGFCHFIESQEKTIKRESEDGQNHVRIMTVHGSKGLQAPIVILPDTIRNSASSGAKSSNRLLWPRQTGLDMPVWAPNSGMDNYIYNQAKATVQEQSDQESKRLLYVAMTRAEDHLYITGYAGKKTPQKSSWYFAIQQALENHPETVKTAQNTLRLEDPQDPARSPDRIDKAAANNQVKAIAPEWLWTPAPIPAPMQATIAPSNSRDEDYEYTHASSTYPPEIARLRGIGVHKLLEHLPKILPENRALAAQKILRQDLEILGDEITGQMIKAICDLLANEKYAHFFSAQSLAELPVMARLENGQIMKGQIDRLYITDHEIWIIDYKTGGFNPDDSPIPAPYQRQLNLYKQAVQKIYPDKTVRAAILWTDLPALSELEE